MIQLDTSMIYTPTPEALVRLRDLAYNLWWSWHPEAQALFQEIDPALWELVYHNPVKFLSEVRQSNLERVANDATYVERLNAVLANLDAYMGAQETWFTRNYPNLNRDESVIAYFSAEFGLNESLPIYSGGLGILSGDHVKETSDMALPFVAVGFLYPQGYFRQRLDHSGWQFAEYTKLNFADAPATAAVTPDGNEVVVEVELPGRMIYAKVYHIQVGRTSLYLMDTDIHPNNAKDRELSARLYGGDQEMRVAQEIVLGIGGVRALRQLGINPRVWHMNEGHSAFLVLELIREKVAAGMSFEQAAQEVKSHTVFTTHTPVPAGNDAFPYDLIEKFFWRYWPQLNLDHQGFMNLARQDQSWGPTFAMTVLAINLSNKRNGVSKLHGEVARGMWQWLYPGKSQQDVPIGHVTNGVHTASWLAPELHALFDTYLGSDWEDYVDDPERWKKIYEIPDDVLWDVRCKLRARTIAFARERTQLRFRGMGQDQPPVWPLLDDNTLTIGFARRFATYKRATLIFRDLERLKAIINNHHRPIQFIFAGKAHPADNPGKHFIQDVYQLSFQPGLAGRILFIEEYDICVGRMLTQGVDVWLNTPRRPHEASGTSGQKAGLNGIPNFSILDGWWPEAYNGRNGWAIGEAREYHNHDEQDWNDAQSFYHILEHEVAPAYYDNRNERGIPRRWMEICKESIATVSWQFSMRRMLTDYMRDLYVPSMQGS